MKNKQKKKGKMQVRRRNEVQVYNWSIHMYPQEIYSAANKQTYQFD